MSWVFNSSGAHLLSNVGRSISTGAISYWIKPIGWSSGDSLTHFFWTLDQAFTDTPSFQKFSDNQIYCGIGGGGGTRIIVGDAGLFTSGQWANWIFQWSAINCFLFRNGVLLGTQVSANVTSTTGYVLGYNGGVPAYKGAHFAVWSSMLSGAEIAAIVNKVSPLNVRPSSLLHYAPLNTPNPVDVISYVVLSQTSTTFDPEDVSMGKLISAPSKTSAAASSVVFRRSLSSIGTRVGSRQGIY